MPAVVRLGADFSSDVLWDLARCSKDVIQNRRLLAQLRVATVRTGPKQPGSAAWTGRRSATGSHCFNAGDRKTSLNIGRTARSLAFPRSNWASLPGSSKRGGIANGTASCAGSAAGRQLALTRRMVTAASTFTRMGFFLATTVANRAVFA